VGHAFEFVGPSSPEGVLAPKVLFLSLQQPLVLVGRELVLDVALDLLALVVLVGKFQGLSLCFELPSFGLGSLPLSALLAGLERYRESYLVLDKIDEQTGTFVGTDAVPVVQRIADMFALLA
jgi:hypothetical protein